MPLHRLSLGASGVPVAAVNVSPAELKVSMATPDGGCVYRASAHAAVRHLLVIPAALRRSLVPPCFYPPLPRCSFCPFMVYGEVMQRWRLAQGAALRRWPKEELERWGGWFLFGLFALILVGQQRAVVCMSAGKTAAARS
eukprot:GHRQ01037168.1.p1 GENE.GHRQ01037168.1~~GHRQ01037168.1.p1  ORF type:complete len:140 (-),score=33.78 GHRQ01037168.1:10-429(-)